jgi:hypothetical protein
MSEIRTEKVVVTTAGEDAAATGSASSTVMHGYLLDIYFDFHASAPSTTDTTVAYNEPDLGNIIVLTDTKTDGLYPVRVQAKDNTGSAITGVYEMYPLNGGVTVSVAGANALTGCVTVYLRYLGL